jgi:transcriptional regulator with XRE-family HTH domain
MEDMTFCFVHKFGGFVLEKLLQDISLGHNLRRLRKIKNFTQTSIIAQLQVRGSNLSRTTYNKIEQGTRNIYISDLMRLQRIYSVSFDEFFQDISF